MNGAKFREASNIVPEPSPKPPNDSSGFVRVADDGSLSSGTQNDASGGHHNHHQMIQSKMQDNKTTPTDKTDDSKNPSTKIQVVERRPSNELCAINLDGEQEHDEKISLPPPPAASTTTPASSNNINKNNSLRVLDPSGSLCYHWSMVVSFAFLYNFWSLSYRFAFREIDFDTVAFWFTLDYSADLIYILDVVINFRTGYLEDGVLQRNIDKIGQHYRECTRFYLDCFCLLPLDILYLSIGFNSILRCTRLVKIYKFWSYSDRTERHTNYPNVFRTFTLVHYILVIFHWNACLFHMISKNKILDIENLYRINDNRCEDILCQYLHAFYWSTLTLTTIGDLPKPRTKGEYFYVTIELFFGLFLFASVLGHVANIVTNVSAARKEFQAKLDAVKTFMRMRRVSEDLQNKVIRWFDYLWVSQKSSDEERSVACLPDRLKAEIAIHVHLDTLKRVDIFQNTEAGFLCELVLRLKPVLFSPGDYVCRKNEVGHEMYIVSKGILEVVTDDGRSSVVATLKAGSYFGEISVLNVGLAGNKRTASVRSVGYSDLFCLNKQDLWDVLKNYPNAEARIRARAEERLSKLGGNGNGGGGNGIKQPLPVAASSSSYYYRKRPKQLRQCELSGTCAALDNCCTNGQQRLSSSSRRQRMGSSSSARYKSSLQMMMMMNNPGRPNHQLDQIVPENYHNHQQFPPPIVTTTNGQPRSWGPRYYGERLPPPPSSNTIDFDCGDDDYNYNGDDASLLDDYDDQDTMVDCGGETTSQQHFLSQSQGGSKPRTPETAFLPTLAAAASQRGHPMPNNNTPDPGIHQTIAGEPTGPPEAERPESSFVGGGGVLRPRAIDQPPVEGRDNTNSPPDHQTTTSIKNTCQPEVVESKPSATADSGRSATIAPNSTSSTSPAPLEAATVASTSAHPKAVDTGAAIAQARPPVVQPAPRLSSSSIGGSCPSGYYLATNGTADFATSVTGGSRRWQMQQQQQPVATCELLLPPPPRSLRRRRRHHHHWHSPSKLADCHSYCYCRNCCLIRPNSIEMEAMMGQHEMRPEVDMMMATAAATALGRTTANCDDDCEMVASYPLVYSAARPLERSTSRSSSTSRRPRHPNDHHDRSDCRWPNGHQNNHKIQIPDAARSQQLPTRVAAVQVQQQQQPAIYQTGPDPRWVQQAAPIGRHHHLASPSGGLVPCIQVPATPRTNTTGDSDRNNRDNNPSTPAFYNQLNLQPIHVSQQQSVSMSGLDDQAAQNEGLQQQQQPQQDPVLVAASSYSVLNPSSWLPDAADESERVRRGSGKREDPQGHSRKSSPDEPERDLPSIPLQQTGASEARR